jgi:hypothetical protein
MSTKNNYNKASNLPLKGETFDKLFLKFPFALQGNFFIIKRIEELRATFHKEKEFEKAFILFF